MQHEAVQHEVGSLWVVQPAHDLDAFPKRTVQSLYQVVVRLEGDALCDGVARVATKDGFDAFWIGGQAVCNDLFGLTRRPCLGLVE